MKQKDMDRERQANGQDGKSGERKRRKRKKEFNIQCSHIILLPQLMECFVKFKMRLKGRV